MIIAFNLNGSIFIYGQSGSMFQNMNMCKSLKGVEVTALLRSTKLEPAATSALRRSPPRFGPGQVAKDRGK